MSLFSVFSQFYAWIFTQTRPWKKYFPVISHIKELEELKTSNLFLLHIDNILTIFYLSEDLPHSSWNAFNDGY